MIWFLYMFVLFFTIITVIDGYYLDTVFPYEEIKWVIFEYIAGGNHGYLRDEHNKLMDNYNRIYDYIKKDFK